MARIIVDEPGYKVYGPYTNQKQGRVNVCIVEGSKKTTMSYARWYVTRVQGMCLNEGDVVDHIDNNPLNNDPSNFQVLSGADNTRKSRQPEYVNFICLQCGGGGRQRAKDHRANRLKGREGPFCSRTCARAWQFRRPSTPTAEGAASKAVNVSVRI